MRPYDSKRDYYRWYFAEYPHAIVTKGLIPYDWMEGNLDKSYTSEYESCMGQPYTREIVGYGIGGVSERPDEKMYFFYDRKHVEKIAAEFPDLIVTLDPFGPDCCPNCGGPAPVIVTRFLPRPALPQWLTKLFRRAG